jgi:hypothetical protein
MKLYKHFVRDNGKYIDDDGKEVTTDELIKAAHFIHEDAGFIHITDYAESNRPISNLRQRLADCQRKGLTGDRI